MGDNKGLLYDINPSYLYSKLGHTFHPSRLLNHGCEDLFLDTINIKHVPNADFSLKTHVGNKTILIDNSSVEDGNIIFSNGTWR